MRPSSSGAEGSAVSEVRFNDVLVFSSFCLDRLNECLWQGERVLKLSPKAFALLKYLVEHPQQLITKGELLKSLWADAHVGDAVLKTHLSHVRRAIQDDVRAPRFIETVHRRGYRFIAKVTLAIAAEGVVDSLVSAGVRRAVDGPRGLLGDFGAVSRSVPQSVVALVEHDLERLTAAERSVLEAASVARAGFCSLAVAAAAERDALEVEELCMRWSNQGRFIKLEQIVECSNGAVGLQCAFLHVLYRQVVYDQIGPARLAELHRRIGIWEEREAGVPAICESLRREVALANRRG